MFKSARKFYFAVASLGSLLLVVISLVSLLQLGIATLLKTQSQNMGNQPPNPQSYTGDILKGGELTRSQRESMADWQTDYTKWRKEQRDFDWATNAKKEQIAMSLAFFLVGLPIFIYHIRFVKKEKE